MDLGGGWFDSDSLLNKIAKCVATNDTLRPKEHKSISDVLIVVDENSAKYVSQNSDLRRGFVEDLFAKSICPAPLRMYIVCLICKILI